MIDLGPSELCSALFDTPRGTGVCEAFGPHERHGGPLVVGVFRCHKCCRVINPRDEYREPPCRCGPPVSGVAGNPEGSDE